MCIFHEWGKWEVQSKNGHQTVYEKKCSKCGKVKTRKDVVPCSFTGYKKVGKNIYNNDSAYNLLEGTCQVCGNVNTIEKWAN